MYFNRHKIPLRLTLPLTVILVGLSSLLIAFRIEQVLLDFAQARSARAAHQIVDQVEASFRLGLALTDQPRIGQSLQRHRYHDASLIAARVESDTGEVTADLGDQDAFIGLNPVWTRQLLAQGVYDKAHVTQITRHTGLTSYAGVTAFDTAGKAAGIVWLAYDRKLLRQTAFSVMTQLWPWMLGVATALVLMLTALATLWIHTANRRLETAQTALSINAEQPVEQDPLEVVTLVDKDHNRFHRLWHEVLLGLLAFALTFAALGALAWKAREIARPRLVEQIDQNASAVLRLTRSHIDRALALGIPAHGLTGVESVFAAELEPVPEIAFIALQRKDNPTVSFSQQKGFNRTTLDTISRADAASATRAGYRVASEELFAGGRSVGRLVIGTPLDYVDQRLRSFLLDLLFAVIVSVVLVRELLNALWQRSYLAHYLNFESLWSGLRRRAMRLGAQATRQNRLDWISDARNGLQRLAEATTQHIGTALQTGRNRDLMRVRLAVFLVALSDELLRPFFSVFASEVSPLAVKMSPTLLAGIPIAAFMLTLALAQLCGPWVTRRVDLRKAMIGVALVGAVLAAATAFATDGLTLVLLRTGSGAVYGLMLVFAQTTIVRTTERKGRARGFVDLPAAIVAAGLCGPVLGGLIVERIGAGAAFGACAICLALAAWTSLSISPTASKKPGNLSGAGGWRSMARVMFHPRLTAVTWFAAVPARLAAAAVLLVVTPLYLLEIGETPVVAGRVLLLYFLTFMVVAPMVARWSDESQQRRSWILWGCAVSAVACALLPVWGGVLGAASCCALLGVGQAMLSAPQLALVTENFESQPPSTSNAPMTPEQALAAFRFIERFGSILAPFAVALVVGRFGLAGAVGIIGAVLAVGAIGVALTLTENKEKSHGHVPV